MVENRVNLEPEVQEVFQAIDAGQNFLLSGGAGSGKTYSLVQVIKQALNEAPFATVACMTYTNAAVREINSRIEHKNLLVSTIHDFLWDNIKSFQFELKQAVIQMVNSEADVEEDKISEDYFDCKDIQYKEYKLIREGFISHDEVLEVSEIIFSKYKKICDILRDKYSFIFVDEYQDTSPIVIKIFLDHTKKSTKKNIIGFFGDAMQSIYDEGVGDISSYVTSGLVTEIKKLQNRRNPRLVYELANILRTDGIVQGASEDGHAPNMKDGSVIDGSIRFFYTSGTDSKLEDLKDVLKWNFDDVKENKELNLTHNLIAPRAGFSKLMEIYDADKIIEYRQRIKELIKKYKVEVDFSEKTFGDVIVFLRENNLAKKKEIDPTPMQQQFIDVNNDLFNKALLLKYDIFKKIYIDKESLIDDKKEESSALSRTGSKRDSLIKHLFKIQTSISLYEAGEHNEFLRKTEFKIKSIRDKKYLNEVIEKIKSMAEESIENVVNFAHESGLCLKDDKFYKFFDKNSYLCEQVMQVKFSEFQNLFRYLEGMTPFSTQHKIKGAEFKNVLVVLNNGNWSKYNFRTLFEGAGTESVLDRTRKIFYVCCTRAKNNLVVYYHQPSPESLQTAEKWFGKENVKDLSIP